MNKSKTMLFIAPALFSYALAAQSCIITRFTTRKEEALSLKWKMANSMSMTIPLA